MTPHINAEKGDFAEVCLLPGDPLRAKFIAKNFLEEVREVTNVRNMLGYTGRFAGRSISVMGTGMGIPSISIYAKELVTEYGVNQLIRVGSCGAIAKNLKLRDVIVANGACTDSAVNRSRFDHMDFAAVPDFFLTQKLMDSARDMGDRLHVGNLFSADVFYTPKPQNFKLMDKMGILAVEMEAAGLFGLAAELRVKAAAICTVSDHIINGGELTSEERQNSFSEMIRIALDASTSK